jgi:manganese/iron transport system ATP-binding protein
VLRHFVLNEASSGKPTPVGVFTDDERPLILQDGKAAVRTSNEGNGGRR